MKRSFAWLLICSALISACGAAPAPGGPIPTRSAGAASPTIPPDQPMQPAATLPVNGAILFRDDFSDPGSGWDVDTSAEGSVGYDNGTYRIQVDKIDFSLWGNPGKSFGDVAIDVEVRRDGGPVENEFGIICRYLDADNFMYATISADGLYGIIERSGGEVKVLTGKGQLVRSLAINDGSQLNYVRFVCKGDRYTLIVNGTAIDAAVTPGFTAGDVGLLGGTFNRPGTIARFDNFTVSEAPVQDIPVPVDEQMPASGTVMFSDDFSDVTSGWDVSQSGNGSTGYGSGDYVIAVDAADYQLWANPGLSFVDAAVEVTATSRGPEQNEIGVVCRYRDGDNFMYAAISAEGQYGLYEVKDAKATLLNRSGELSASAAIKRGGAANRLRLICRGDTYQLIINEVPAESITHGGPAEGDVGLIAGTYAQGGAEIHFDDFSVTAP